MAKKDKPSPESHPVSAAAHRAPHEPIHREIAAEPATTLAGSHLPDTLDEHGLRQRISFEQFLADLSAEFVNVRSDHVDAEVVSGLRQLVDFLDIDRASLARITSEGRLFIIQSYAIPGVRPLPQGEMIPRRAWAIGELAQGNIVRITDVDSVPAEAVEERQYMQETGLKSHLGIPINLGGTYQWFLGIAMFRRRYEFPVDLIPRLRLIGEVFANALARRDADHELHLMQSELAHVARVSTVGQLATSIAHEINQPLCAIVSNAQAALRLLAAPKPDLSDIRGALQEIVAEGQRAGEVVSRSHALLKRRDLEFKPISLNDVVADVFSIIHSNAVIRQVALQMDLAQELPAVMGDKVQLQQVLLNLIINALDATVDAHDGPRLVMLRTSLSGHAVRVTVQDTGVGLTPEVIARMFEPFFTTKPQGLGMGLAINQSIVKAHNGSMGAASAQGTRGASVWFEIPSIHAAAEMPALV